MRSAIFEVEKGVISRRLEGGEGRQTEDRQKID
jgi:hypothetical protein